MRLLLRYLILDQEIHLDLDLVNRKISLLKCDREFITPPTLRKNEILELTKLSFSSSEMSSDSTALALVSGEFVSADDPRYSNFLLLLEIMASLQCYSFSQNDLISLAKNIQIHNKNHVILYPKRINDTDGESAAKSITPKLHSLLHFPNQIRLFGSPRYSWCFRYE